MFGEYGFKTPEEFCDKKEFIREEFNNWTYGRRYMYKCYVYSRDFFITQRDLIWEYLNEPTDSIYFVDVCLKLRNIKERSKK